MKTNSIPHCYKAALLLATLSPAHSLPAGEWDLSGDVRGGYFQLERTARDGTKTDDSNVLGRLRVAAERELSNAWRLRVRAAGRYGDDQDRFSAYLRPYSPTPTGTRIGDTTLDELYLHFSPPDAGWSVRAGRFQSKFELPGVAAKSLSRNDSPNIDVTWTDGIHFVASALPGWKSHLILQYNHRKGAGPVARPPLDFSDSGSRAGVVAGLEAEGNPGPIVLRMVDLTWLPAALATYGTDSARRQDYLATSSRIAAAWPLGRGDSRLVAGGEIGYAWRTPFGQTSSTGEFGRARGLAWQLQVSVYEVVPDHNIAVVYGHTGAGWLLSPDFRPNDELAEIRYQWRFSANWSVEARLRRREELKTPDTAQRARVDRDFYLRLSGKF